MSSLSFSIAHNPSLLIVLLFSGVALVVLLLLAESPARRPRIVAAARYTGGLLGLFLAFVALYYLLEVGAPPSADLAGGLVVLMAAISPWACLAIVALDGVMRRLEEAVRQTTRRQ